MNEPACKKDSRLGGEPMDSKALIGYIAGRLVEVLHRSDGMDNKDMNKTALALCVADLRNTSKRLLRRCMEHITMGKTIIHLDREGGMNK